MQLTERHFIHEGSEQSKECERIAHLSKNLFNATLYAVRQHFFETGHYLPFAKVCNDFTLQGNPDYTALPRKVSQGTMRIVDKAFKSFFQSLAQYKASDGRLINADVNGALNILRKCKPEAFADGVVGVVVHPVIARMTNGFIDFH